MEFLISALKALPAAASSPFGLAAFVVTIAAWVVVSLRTRRLNSLLNRIKQVPAADRADLIRAEMDAVVPAKISAEQWIRSRQHRYIFGGFLAFCFLLAAVSALAILAPADAELNRLFAEMEALRAELRQTARTVTERSFDSSTSTLRVELTADERTRLDALTTQMAELTERLNRVANLRALSEENSRQLQKAEAAIHYNRSLLYLSDGDLSSAISQLNESVDALGALADESSDEESKDLLALSLKARSAVQRELGQEEKARPDEKRSVVVLKGGGFSGKTVSFEAAVLPAITVTPLSGQGLPEIREALVVDVGVDTSGLFQVAQRAQGLGGVMLVDPGQYKIFIEPAGQQRLLLIDSVKVEAGRKTIVNADPLVGYVQVIPVEGDGFPRLGDVYLAAGGTDESSSHSILQRTSEIGVPMMISPGEYDVLCTPEVGRGVSLKRKVGVSAGQLTVVDARESVAAIILRDPQMAGLDLDSIFVIKAGTDTSGLFHYVQTTDAFGKAMLVGANGPYDVLIRPKGGQLVTIAKNVTPEAGAVSYVGGN